MDCFDAYHAKGYLFSIPTLVAVLLKSEIIPGVYDEGVEIQKILESSKILTITGFRRFPRLHK